ncbi:glycosyltransferase family 2 protein [Helicobacter canadensis]|uniref:Glycosyl transferase n=1 Tax=Helicobacter canadensis MIT 98-5491 TaxID=537970 RepID=C5ZZA4_9HELI|nr:glycosyltransferase family 2 protein [Helicobacter canadensis]EES89362.1 putative glycosyl transferase [Helicobacter canadensis MIT 98-5491]EFR48150.1 glycosyltransferase, group 2 family protein [Helicobacter canadensis MIT 98-5491]STO99397.1 beta-1,3-galactosyltransferase [Helicobacter canadensis]
MFFTIAIPTYNRANLLQRCLDSIKKQDFMDYEVLILDDCSTDNTIEIVQEYLKDKRYQYIKMPKKMGFGDKVYKFAQDSKLYKGDWVLLLSDDEFLYNENHLENIYIHIQNNPQVNFISVDAGYGYGEIVIFEQQSNVVLPETFLYQNLNDKQKEILQTKIKVVYKKDFLIQQDPFNNVTDNHRADITAEVDYLKLYKAASMGYVGGIAHIFGVTPNARAKYLDFYNWITSSGMCCVNMDSQEKFYLILKQYYSEVSMCLNAFFDWGGNELAGALSYFYDDENYPIFLRRFAQIYKDKFQDKLYCYYEDFNKNLMTEIERDIAIENSKNIVIYGENSWRVQLEDFLVKRGKHILFVADDKKEGYKTYEDIVREKENIDLVFISSGSPKIIYQMMQKLQFKKNRINVATLILRDENWKYNLN